MPAASRPQLHAALVALLLVAWESSSALAQPFTSVISPAFTGHVSFCLGATWVDVDQDGDLDLYAVTGFASPNDNAYFRNDGGDTFTRVLGVPLVQDGHDSACSSWADYDNDGDLDTFVSNLVSGGGILYDGQGGGVYAANGSAGLGGPSQQGTGCAWGDYDNDGHVDLVIAALSPTIPTASRLFHNDGDGTFTEDLSSPIASTVDQHHHPTWSDYDRDGDLDLFFATGPIGSVDLDRMYRNELVESGTATFTPITTGTFATDVRDSQSLMWIDYDHDRDLDMFAVNYTSVPNQLYRNDGGGTFTKITTGAIVTDGGSSHGATWGDFDNDGDLDLYVARDLSQSNRYYRNDGGDVFTSVTTGAFVNEARSNYGVSAGDYDQDGDLDLFAPTARSEGPSLLFRNDLASGAHWLVVTCEGTSSNRSAIGAKVEVLATIGGVGRWLIREILAGTSYGGPDALEAHIGLAEATVVDTVRVSWPSGNETVLTNVPANQRIEIVEGPPVAVGTQAPRAGIELACAPNPLTGTARFTFQLDRAERVTLRVHDLAGRVVTTLAEGHYAAGTHVVEIAAGALPRAGVYLATLDAGSRRAIRRIVRIDGP